MLNISANIDETGTAFIKNVVLSMFDEGVVGIVPVMTDVSPITSSSYDIIELRVARIDQWFPSHVQVHVYNEKTGQFEDITLPKKMVYIIENPFYSIMNQPNSIARRLVRKLALLDMADERASSGKMDLIIQLPYVIKSEARKKQAEDRRKEIERQLKDSAYGIAYTDGTERIVQLNRPAENNLQSQIEYLTNMLYGQLGITQSIIEGTADEQTMLNYYDHTISPIATAIVEEITRKYLSANSITRGYTVTFIRDPFKLVPVKDIATIADTFTRNEILTSNEVRSIVGYRPVDTASANELRNKNLNVSKEDNAEHYANTEETEDVEKNQNDSKEEEK